MPRVSSASASSSSVPTERVDCLLVGETEVGEHLKRCRCLLVEQAEQQMLGTDVTVVQLTGFLLGALDDVPGFGVNRSNIAYSFRCSEPRLPVYFLCTACRLTPSSRAISCHVHPWSRALVTWSSSRRSASSRRARTARNPTAGSGLLASDAVCAVSIDVNLCCATPSCQHCLTGVCSSTPSGLLGDVLEPGAVGVPPLLVAGGHVVDILTQSDGPVDEL